MATRRTVTTVEHDLKDGATEGAADEKTAEERIADEDLTLALAEIGDGEGKVQCKRTAPKDKVGMAGTYAPAEFSIERLRDEWGGGTYELYFRLPNGQLKTKRVVQILDRVASVATPDRTTELIAALQNGKGNNTGEMLTAFLGLMQAQQKSTTDILVAMIGAQGKQTAPQGMGPTELVAFLGAIDKLRGGDKSGGSLDELVKVLKIAKELGGEAGEGEGILGKLATMAGPLLEKFAERLPAPAPAVPMQAPRPPVSVAATVVRPTPPSAAPTPPTDPTTSTEDANLNLRLINWLRETLKLVLDKAAQDKDPELYADYVLDNLPEGLTADVILPQLTAEDALEKLAFFDARAATYQDWLAEFRDAMVERIQEAMAEEARHKARENPPPAPEVPAAGSDPVGVLYGSPNPDTDAES